MEPVDNLAKLDDSSLWARVKSGHEQAFDAIFVRHHEPIYNYCFRRTANWSAAEDLMSATFLELWKGRQKFEIVGRSARPLLFGISANLPRNQRRSLRAYEKVAIRLGNDAAAAQDAAPLPEDQLAAADLAAQAVRALKRLRPSDRDIISMRIFGELSYAEIAEALGIPEGTVASRINRAQKRLAEDPALSLEISAPAITRGLVPRSAIPAGGKA